MTSSFRDGKKYEKLTVVLSTGVYYLLDTFLKVDTTLSRMQIKNLRFMSGSSPFTTASLVFLPYHI